MQFVGNEQNAAPFAGKLLENINELGHLRRGEHGGGLVQNQQLNILQKAADDLHALLFTHRQGVHLPVRIDRQAIFLAHRHNALAQRAHGTVFRLSQVQRDIFRDGQSVEQRKVLKHHAHSERPGLGGSLDRHLLIVPQHLTGIGLDHAIDHLHEGAFAGAILPQQCVNFTGRDFEVHRVVGNAARIGFGDTDQFQSCCFLLRHKPDCLDKNGFKAKARSMPLADFEAIRRTFKKNCLSGQIFALYQ